MTQNPLVQEWLVKAEDDWRAANTLMQEEVAYGAVCFHAQQVAEKSLKAYLTAHNQVPPRTHDLFVLLDLCKQSDASLADYSDEASLLNPVYIDVRYPGGDIRVFDEKTAQEVLAAAGAIRSAILQRLQLS